MSETDPAIVGVQSCGCVTYADANPDGKGRSARMKREDDKALMEIVRSGGEIRRTTVGEARKLPNFLPSRCPHKPKGWKVTR